MDTANVTLYYWPIRFRGNFIRFILSEANVPFKDVKDDGSVREFVFGGSQPVFAPPVLTINEDLLLT